MAFNFIDYIKNIAITMKAISHIENSEKQKRFYRVSGLNGIEELLNNLTDPKMYPAILANDLEFGKVGDVSTSNNFLDRQSHIFYIVGYCDLNDFNAKAQSMKDLKVIMFKIMGKMRKDYRDDNKGAYPGTGMRNLDVTSFFYQAISGFGMHNHGYMVSFDIAPPAEEMMKFDGSDWEN